MGKSIRQVAGAALDTVLDRTIVPGYSSIGYAVRRRLPGWPADPAPNALSGKAILVTGASSGIGAETALQAARLGADVHMVVRDLAKGERVADSVRASLTPDAARDLGSPVARGGAPAERARLTVWQCDVSDLDSVAAFTTAFLAAGHSLAGIVHNAGALPATRKESAQGHEMTMALHVLGPLAMTEQLAPAMAGQHARVVFVTSGGMYAQALRADDPEYLADDYAGAQAYARSKRAQVELMPLLQQRWGGAGVCVLAMHPGWVDTPGVSDSLPTFSRLTGAILRDAPAGADTITWLLAATPTPPAASLWHDRRRRPTSYLRRTAPTESQRQAMWSWVSRALGW